MTEPKPIYETNLITEPAPTSATSYWQKVAEQERKKANDNLRLVAERAGEIDELLRRLEDAKKEIERLTRLLELERSTD